MHQLRSLSIALAHSIYEIGIGSLSSIVILLLLEGGFMFFLTDVLLLFSFTVSELKCQLSDAQTINEGLELASIVKSLREVCLSLSLKHSVLLYWTCNKCLGPLQEVITIRKNKLVCQFSQTVKSPSPSPSSSPNRKIEVLDKMAMLKNTLSTGEYNYGESWYNIGGVCE